MALQLASLWNRGLGQFGNGLLGMSSQELEWNTDSLPSPRQRLGKTAQSSLTLPVCFSSFLTLLSICFFGHTQLSLAPLSCQIRYDHSQPMCHQIRRDWWLFHLARLLASRYFRASWVRNQPRQHCRRALPRQAPPEIGEMRSDEWTINIREIKIHVYRKRQTPDSSWEFLRIENKQITTVPNDSSGFNRHKTTYFCVEAIKIKRKIREKPGHVVQIHVCRLA